MNDYYENHESREELRASHAPDHSDPEGFGVCKNCPNELTEEEANEMGDLCDKCYAEEQRELAEMLRHEDEEGCVI